MKSGVGFVESVLNGMGSPDHIEGNPGDYIGADNRLHCAVCREAKEYYLEPFKRYVPSLCACGRRARDEFEARQRQSQEIRMVEELAKYSLMDEKLTRATFANAERRPDMDEAYSLAKGYVERFDEICSSEGDMKGLLIYGQTGTGKSYLAACVANALMATRVPVLYTSVIRLTNSDPDAVHEVIGKMSRAKLLVLDDFGAERGTDFKLEQVFDIVETRSNNRKPLIITTNYNLTDMRGENDVRYKRIWERIKAMCYPVRMNGESWRKKRTEDAIAEFRKMVRP